MTIDIEAVNIPLGYAVGSDGQTIPITDFFDADGDDCVFEDAVSCVAGPDRNGNFWAIDLSAFDESAVH